MESVKIRKDRISALPCAVRYHILSFLDATDVLSLCFTSKRWINLWTTLPYLNFNAENYFSSFPKKNRWPSEFEKSDFVDFVDEFIFRRHPAAPIFNFCFNSKHHFDISPESPEAWITYAIQHQLQYLQIMTFNNDSERFIQFPSNCNGCKSLTTLNFKDFDGKIFSTCPKLEALRLEDLDLVNTPEFSICSPTLKKLTIDICYEKSFDVCNLTIMAPKLKKFKYYGIEPFLFTTDNLTSPEHVEITMYKEPLYWYSDLQKETMALRMFDMLNIFQNAKTITLSLKALLHLAVSYSKLKELKSPFSNLECLKLRMSCKSIAIPNSLLNYFLGSDGVLEISEEETD